jgi:hypothetical protein
VVSIQVNQLPHQAAGDATEASEIAAIAPFTAQRAGLPSAPMPRSKVLALILAKLGVAGRGEAAAIAHRLSLNKP